MWLCLPLLQRRDDGTVEDQVSSAGSDVNLTQATGVVVKLQVEHAAAGEAFPPRDIRIFRPWMGQ